MENEKRLIDANALIAEYDRVHIGEPGNARKLMEDAPTVDAVEVVHGRWDTEKCNHKPHRIKNPEKWVIYKCSVCGYSNGRKQSNYCPNCGADMRERKGNET